MNAVKVQNYELTRKLDPTRPVIDNSGYCHTKTDITDLHVNPPDGEACRQWWVSWRRSIAENGNFPAWPNRPTYCDGFRHQGQPVVISETGNWWILGTLAAPRWIAQPATLSRCQGVHIRAPQVEPEPKFAPCQIPGRFAFPLQRQVDLITVLDHAFL